MKTRRATLGTLGVPGILSACTALLVPLPGHAADSALTLHGAIDIAYLASRAGGMKRSAIESGTHDLSVIGLHGREKLGDHLSAIFGLEYGIAADGNGGIGNPQFGSRSLARYQFVGLAGDFGTLIAGRTGSPLNALQDHDAGAASLFSPLLTLLPGVANYGADYTRLSNAVRYSSPEIGGAHVMAAYGFASFAGDEAAHAGAQERVMALHVGWHHGPFSMLVAQQQTHDRATMPAADLRDTGIGATWDFGSCKLMGLALSARRGGAAGAHSVDQGLLGITVPVGAQGLLRLVAGRLADRTLAAADARSWMVGYDHNLSKRTLLYGGYNLTHNAASARYGADAYNRPPAGDNARLYGVGIRHFF